MKKLGRIKMLPLLEAVKFVLFVIMVLMFINFNTKSAIQTAQTKQVASNTNTIVKDQDNILTAIKQVTTDGNINSAQQTAIIICMLQVPVENRTTDLQAQCRNQSRTVTSDSAAQRTQSSNGIVGSGSSSNTSTNSSTSQPDNSQSPQGTGSTTPGPSSQPPLMTLFCKIDLAHLACN